MSNLGKLLKLANELESHLDSSSDMRQILLNITDLPFDYIMDYGDDFVEYSDTPNYRSPLPKLELHEFFAKLKVAGYELEKAFPGKKVTAERVPTTDVIMIKLTLT